MCGGSDDKDTSSSSSSDDSSSSSTYGMSPGQAQAMGQGYQGGDTVGAPSGAVVSYDFGDDDDDDYSDPNAGMSMADQYASYGQGNQGTTATATTTDSGMSDYEQAAFGTTQEDFYNNQGTTDTDTDSGSTYDEIPTAAQINAASGFTDDDEDYTPTSAELNAAIDAIGGVNLTDDQYAQPVDFTTTGSGNDFTTTAQADTDVSGAEFVANTDPVTGENTTSTLASNEPVSVSPPVEDTTPVVAPVYTDSAGVQHSTQAAADAADAQYAEAAAEKFYAELARLQALVDQVVTQDSAQNVTAAPVAEDADLGAAIEAAEAFDAYNQGIEIGPQFPKDQFGNVVLDDGPEDDSRYDFVDDLPDDRFDFVDETEALLAELGVDVDLLGDNTDTGINLESSRYDFVDDLPDDANDFVETPVTDLQKVQDLVDSGVDRSLAQALVESGGTPGEAAGLDKYDFGFDGGIKGSETAPSVLTDLALGDGTESSQTLPNTTREDMLANENYATTLNIASTLENMKATDDAIKNADSMDIMTTGDGLTDYEREVLGTDTASFYNNLANTETGAQTSIPTEAEINAFRNQEDSFSMSGGSGPVTATDTSGTSASTSGTTDKTGTEAYLSAVTKISDPNYDPNAKGNLTNAEQYALYGARGQTPNAAESAYLSDLLSDATHKEDSTEKDVNGKPIYSAGDKVTVQSFGEKLEDGIVGFIDTFLNPLSIFGEKFTIGGANAAKVEAQLEAYKNGGTFIYNDDGAVVGVASPNFDASGDGNNDTVVLFDESGNKTVTGDGIAVTDVTTSNNNSDGEDFDIDIVNSVKTYTNPDEAGGDVVVGTPGDDETGFKDDDDDFIICEEGFEFDPKEGICMPIVGVGDGTGTGGTGFSADKRDRTDPVIVRPEQPTVGALKVRGAKQFAQGGMVTSNIDNFVQSLRG